MSNYSKGNWKVQPVSNGHYNIYTDGGFIADVFDNIEGYEGNAYLIASAPLLYKALKAIINKSRDTDMFATDEITDAIDAIRKAEGK